MKFQSHRRSPGIMYPLSWAMLLALFAMLPPAPTHAATRIDVDGPAGSGVFGTAVTLLPNGNFVVTDPEFDSATAVNVGAVHLFNGTTGALISTLTGSTPGDQVGFSGVTALADNSYVVSSPNWTNGTVFNAGAVTFCAGATGCSGTVSATNSLIGSSENDRVGGVTPLANGNYVVNSWFWDNGGVADAGAVTFCSGINGCTGTISAANSLIGTTFNEQVGDFAVIPLTNGAYVVRTPLWDNGVMLDVGAVTLCSAVSGCTGTISIANSLVGATANDQVGGGGVTAFDNNTYVVSSPSWDNGGIFDAGAVTFCSATSSCAGMVTVANSLVGATSNERVGAYDYSVTALTGGGYVVSSPSWDNGGTIDVGAVTFCAASDSCIGTISAANSLIGATVGDQVGIPVPGLTALVNGGYVVTSPSWDNGGTPNVGAVTYCAAPGGCTGIVSAANSLIGSSAGDQVGIYGATALSSGAYIVSSPLWANGGTPAIGAVTFCAGPSGCIGAVSAANSLIGSSAGDQVGFSTAALSNGAYIVSAPSWDNGGIFDAGAVTYCPAVAGCTGAVSAATSLVGSSASDQVGGGGAVDLANGAYVVNSPMWNNGAVADTGAVTLCNNSSGCTGTVSAANSLIGSTPGDQVGGTGISALTGGAYVIRSQSWDNGAISEAGAVSLCSSVATCIGPLTDENSVLGTVAGGRWQLPYVYDSTALRLIVGQPTANKVTILQREYVSRYKIFLPIALRL